MIFSDHRRYGCDFTAKPGETLVSFLFPNFFSLCDGNARGRPLWVPACGYLVKGALQLPNAGKNAKKALLVRKLEWFEFSLR